MVQDRAAVPGGGGARLPHHTAPEETPARDLPFQLFAAAPPAADLALQCITAAAALDDVRCLAVELFLTLLEVPGACRAPAVLGRFFAVLLELLATVWPSRGCDPVVRSCPSGRTGPLGQLNGPLHRQPLPVAQQSGS